MIREALELLTRPLRRKRWRRRREQRIKAHERWDNRPEWNPKLNIRFNPLATDEEICIFPPGPIPCTWEERDHADIKQDAHRWAESKLEPWRDAHKRAAAFLGRIKSDLKRVNVVEDLREASLDPNFVNPLTNDEDMTPFWLVPKEVRDAKRRAKLKQALRPRVPRGWEEGV